jgi:hypothetical protein
MTYAFSGGDLLLTSPRMRSHHRLGANEALALLDAHRQDYRMAFASDLLMAQSAIQLSSQLAECIEQKRRWDKAAGR